MDFRYMVFNYDEIKSSYQNLQILPTQKKTCPYEVDL